MAKIIQQVRISETENLYIFGYDGKELEFKTSLDFKETQFAEVETKLDMVKAGVFIFPKLFLDKFIEESYS